jgi:hypothetical protein
LWHHCQHRHASPSGAPITVTINPEARVSVVMSGAFPTPVACGMITRLPVKIVNQGFLTGLPEEWRELRITLTKASRVDVTVAFGARHVNPDLGGRDCVHLFMQCT